MKVTFDHSIATAEHIRTFYFKPQSPVSYIAGQFTEFRLPHTKPDDRGIKRWFTLSSSPSESLLSITTKFADTPSSFKQTLRSLPEGMELDFAEPMGDFVLPKDSTIPLLFVAGGIGITPMRSMIKFLYDTKERRDITLLYAVNVPGERAFKELFEAYKLNVTYLTKETGPDWDGEVGSLSAERILAVPGARSRQIYLSGPEPMVESFYKQLSEAGLPEHQLVGDYFPGYSGV